MKKDVNLNETKLVMNSNLEMGDLKDKFLELENVDDLWYFIKSSAGSWIAGSTK